MIKIGDVLKVKGDCSSCRKGKKGGLLTTYARKGDSVRVHSLRDEVAICERLNKRTKKGTGFMFPTLKENLCTL